MTDKEITAIVKSKTFEKDGRTKITCASAHEIREKHGIELARIGRICDSEKIKIVHCELGCFE